MNNHSYGSKVPQNPNFGDLNRHFQPNMRKIQTAMSSDLCIYSLFHGFSSMRTAVAPSLSLDQRHGTCSKNNLREPDMQIDCFRRTLKTCLFDQYSAH